MVARMIGSAARAGRKRQVFFVSLGGFDTHDALLTTHPALLTSVADAHHALSDGDASSSASPTR